MRSLIKSIALAIIVGTAAFLCLALAAAIGNAGTWEASCYGSESGPVTTSGESFVPSGLTAAHRTLPFGTRLLVKHGSRSIAVTITDRGPYIAGRDLDLSMGACQAIDLTDEGVGAVEVEQVEAAESGAPELPRTGGPHVDE